MDLESIYMLTRSENIIFVEEPTCDTVTTGHESTKINHCAVIFDEDRDFGSADVIDTDQFQKSELVPSQS